VKDTDRIEIFEMPERRGRVIEAREFKEYLLGVKPKEEIPKKPMVKKDEKK